MKVTEYIAEAKGKTLISFEILPPLKGGSMQTIFKTLDPLMEFKPPFVDVTYHREEFLYQMQPSGYYQKLPSENVPEPSAFVPLSCIAMVSMLFRT